VKILIVDDEQRLLDALSIGFQFQWQDAVVLTAHDGAEGLRLFYDHTPDVVLLDVGMPGVNGFAVLQEIRRVSDTPVIMLTAAGDEMDHVRGLELGADDYLVKPFSRIALMAHVKAVLRRAQMPPPVEALPDFVAGDLTMHFQNHQVTLRGQPIALTPMEYKLLYHLVRNAGRLMPHQALLDRVWGPGSDAMDHHVRVCISKLRAKIEAPGAPPSIVTERGLGYRFVRRTAPASRASSPRSF
jgi:DNA-binding response OmpR family regulator